ncbi:MAG: hypothetical protein BGO33_02815 [Bacteroidia bacterium 43-41]|nr:MAG: hypothetical protein BGO33_02815 [Bacteroidia bacterium 43-41]
MIGAIALGLVACNANDQPEVAQHETNSYASITVKFPKGATVRALPGDYNPNGTWTGRDAIETVTVFLVNTGKGVVDYNSFNKSSFSALDDNGVLTPNLALKATAGESIRVYTVINGNTDILATLKATSAANFATVFAGEAAKVASEVAKYNADKTETIMMTNDKDDYAMTVVAGVTEADALDVVNPKNHVQVNVERVVSRAMLTVEPATGDNWTVKARIAGVETAIATVTGVTYAVGQSNKKFYIMKKADYATPDPVYTYVPAAADWATNNTYFDYSGLGSFTAAQQWAYDAADVKTPLAAETTSKFVLPVNHVVTEADLTVARAAYKKGNTTYFEVRATFVPLQIDGESYSGAAETVYLGANDNKFYSTRALAEAQGQKATEFKDGVMKYVLWLNPNSLVATVAEPNPMVSPTVRNQVYHAHIDAFLRMGLPNNPLDPNDSNDPNNPDNPIDPTDPLKTEVTYLSVSVKVLPWTIHTYKYSLTDGGTMY